MSDELHDIKIAAQTAERADVLMDLGRYQEAIPLLARAISEQPEDSWLHSRLANAFYHINETDKALDSAQRAIHIDPNNSYAHCLAAWALLRKNQVDPALEHARTAVRIQPEQPGELYVLAVCEYRSGHYKKALAAAEQAVQLDPEDSSLHQLLGDLYFALQKPKQAELHYREALRHDPEDAGIHCDLGQVLAAQHKVYEAADHYLNAARLEPADERIREQLFNLILHDIADQPLASQQQVLAEFEPVIRTFYEDELARRSWVSRMGVGSMITLWIGVLLLVTLLMSLATGKDITKLGELTLVMGSLYIFLWIGKRFLSWKRTRLRTARLEK